MSGEDKVSEVEISWLKQEMGAIKQEIKDMNATLTAYFITSCPAKHERIDSRIDRMENRQNYMFGAIAVIVFIATLLKEPITKLFTNGG